MAYIVKNEFKEEFNMKLNEIFKSEEVLGKAQELLGENLEAFEAILDTEDALNVVPYSRFKEVNDAKKTFETETKSLKTKLTKLSNDKNITPEEFEEQKKAIIGEYDTKIKNIQKDFEQYKKDSYVKSKLNSAKCKYSDLILGKIDMSKLETTDDGKTYLYLDEQIEALKNSYPDMFEAESSGAPSRNDGIYTHTPNEVTNI